MKINSLLIENFRGIGRVQIDGLGDTIVIAGQNGSGKSCVFDAIRLLKSTYGGYQQNEWQQFFGEFAIQLHGGAKNLQGLFNDKRSPLVIECEFELRPGERDYLNRHAAELLEETIWQTLLPEAFQYGGYKKALFANQFRERQNEVNMAVAAQLTDLQRSLSEKCVLGRVAISPEGQVQISNSRLLSVIFTNYKPRDIGVIDFHGAQRHYGREVVQGINLNLEQISQQHSQHTLYNYNNKYNNVKSEMAGNFIKELLAEKASANSGVSRSLSDTLKELFESFFPDKRFLGPQATVDGGLSFPVVTSNGAIHDLDELSSGEKEILYGYLRIRSSAPKDSIILLDEPELHLNPRLIRGLPEFYRKHLGEELQNQIWLVTHSDALIREAVGKPGFNVFHMIPCGSEFGGKSQLRPLTASDDLEVAISDLVGDLAAYRPGGKGLIFEGGGDSDFDKTLTASLFGDELKGINLLSGSNKARVRQLHEVLERAHKNGDLPTKFYAIVDRDSEDNEDATSGLSRFVWDVYHAENYLLAPEVIAKVVESLGLGKRVEIADVKADLELAARQVIPAILQHRMRVYVNALIVGSINLRFDPGAPQVGKSLHQAAVRSKERIERLLDGDLQAAKLAEKEAEIELEIKRSFLDGSWIRILPGREILRRYVGVANVAIGYENFRNLIISQMVAAGYKPEGMKRVVEKIIAD